MFNFFDRLKNGIMMSGISLKYMAEHQELLTFAAIRATVYALIYPPLIMIFFYTVMAIVSYEKTIPPMLTKNQGWILITVVSIVLGTLAIFLFYFISTLFSIATIDYLLALFNGQKASVQQSLHTSFKKWFALMLFAGINTVLFWVLFFLRGEGDDKKQPSLVQKLLGEALSMAWYFATFFVTPILAHENKNIITIIKESFHLMKKRFGEIVGITLGVDLVGSFIFPGIIIVLFSIIRLFTGEKEITTAIRYQYPWLVPTILILFAATLFARSIIMMAKDIFKAAAFNYAHNKNTGPFESKLIEDNFQRKHL